MAKLKIVMVVVVRHSSGQEEESQHLQGHLELLNGVHVTCRRLRQRPYIPRLIRGLGEGAEHCQARWPGREAKQLWKARVLCREGIMVTHMQRDLSIPRGATPLPHHSPSPFPFLLWRSWVIRRNSLLGKGGAGVPVC